MNICIYWTTHLMIKSIKDLHLEIFLLNLQITLALLDCKITWITSLTMFNYFIVWDLVTFIFLPSSVTESWSFPMVNEKALSPAAVQVIKVQLSPSALNSCVMLEPADNSLWASALLSSGTPSKKVKVYSKFKCCR